MANDNDRFRVVYKQSNAMGAERIQIIVDTVTGVNYIFKNDGYAGGLTPLLDRDGKPVITPMGKDPV